MLNKRFFTCAAAGALLCALGATNHSRGESESETKTAAQAVLAQQKIIDDNQTAIDARLAEIAEDLRVARIFVSRSGGKK